MLDEKDLQAIAQLIDKKLEPIKEDMQDLKAGQTRLQEDIGGLHENIGELHENIRGLHENIGELQEDIEGLKEGQEEIRGALNALIEWADKASEAEKFPLPKVGGTGIRRRL